MLKNLDPTPGANLFLGFVGLAALLAAIGMFVR